MLGLLKNILANHNEKTIRRHDETVQRINALEPELQRLPDAELAAQTAKFRAKLQQGETLEPLLPEAFATVREASRRVLGLRHFDVQLIGGMVLHEGNIAEMRTGEGKTLVATLPAYLNALAGHGVHVITVNDYLARRDAEWMGRIYRFLGMDVGLIVHGLDHNQRRQSYAADITYGTNNEFGFDYLRDNMVLHPSELVQRPLHYAIVDEVDSILVDEARTPLIISGPADKPTDLYYKFAKIAEKLEEGGDYTVDEKARTAAPTEEGVHRVERMLNVPHLYADEKTDYAHYLNNALKAKALFKLDRDYVVKDDQVIIVDEFTGRLMFGRRWSDGLHQAVEAKEGCKIERETVTLATITFQNFFRMYKKLAGMTGTALTEEEEFRKIYGLDVIVIPTNMPMVRKDLPDVVYKTAAAKFRATVEEIAERHQTGQPLLVGTISIEKSEMLSAMLNRRGIKHQVLNAKYHEKEAEIIAQAGRLGAVTIATNMAGRGTDIMLGGNPEFLAKQKLRSRGHSPDVILAAAAPVVSALPSGTRVAGADGMPAGLPGAGGVATLPPALGPSPDDVAKARDEYLRVLADARRETDREHDQVVSVGGLHIIGTERHESRRIDNQLRGRAGRQGDPGSSRFYVGLDDDLMRLFGGEAVARIMDRLGIEEDMPIDAAIVSRAIENAQKKVEARNFDARKHILEYDDVMNKQREIIYRQRREVLDGVDLRAKILDMVGQTIDTLLDTYCNEQVHPEEWDLDGLLEQSEPLFLPRAEGTGGPRLGVEDLQGGGRKALRDVLAGNADQVYAEREEQFGSEMMREIERIVTLRAVDEKWVDHLTAMDDLREGIGLRAYGQRDPLIEYKSEAYDMFQGMIRTIQEDIVRNIYHVSVVREPERRRTTEWGGGAGPAWGGPGAPATDAGYGGGPAVRGRGPGPVAMGGGGAPAPQQPYVSGQTIGRNDPCWCGSGKKYKKCHGANA